VVHASRALWFPSRLCVECGEEEHIVSTSYQSRHPAGGTQIYISQLMISTTKFHNGMHAWIHTGVGPTRRATRAHAGRCDSRPINLRPALVSPAGRNMTPHHLPFRSSAVPTHAGGDLGDLPGGSILRRRPSPQSTCIGAPKKKCNLHLIINQ
jgi:hypothetical protein